KADAAWIIIDGDEYFSNLYENILRAKQRIIFLGWDFDSRLNMIRSRKESERHKAQKELGRLMRHKAKNTPGLEIFILAWDFSTIYLPMRDLFQKIKFTRFNTDIKFIFDGQHPLGSSQHQKLVLVDDALAYCGGL